MRRIILCFIPLLALCACSARLEKASERDFSTPGRGAFHIKVNEPLTLGAEGKYRFFVPSDVLTRPGASFGYAVYAEPGVGRVDKQIHCIASRLERGAWRWEKETWARREAVSYSILSAGGRNWTVQMLPVDGEKDWFSALWAQKGRETPPFWLAKRWSATPDDDIRLVVEYREAAPQCLQERLLVDANAKKDNRNYISPRGKELLRGCEADVEAFSRRADEALVLGGGAEAVAQSAPSAQDAPDPHGKGGLTARPSFAPDTGKLVGHAEFISRGDDPLP